MKPAIRWHHSLSSRVMILVGLPAIVLFAFMIFENRVSSQKVLAEALQLSVDAFSQTINLALSVHLGTTQSTESLEPYLAEFIAPDSNGVSYLAISNEAGELIAQTAATPDLSTTLPNQPVSDVLGAQTLYDVAVPILLVGDQLGTLHYGLSLEQAVADTVAILEQQFWESALTAGALLLISLAIVVMFVSRLNSRISKLLENSRLIAAGQYDDAIEDTGQDEIHLFSLQMEAMRQAIRESVLEISSSREEATTLNAELQTALDQLKQSQESLIQSEKLAGLGSIVAAVAHEINTPIGNALTVATTLNGRTDQFEASIAAGLKRSTLTQHIEDQRFAAKILEDNLVKAAELIESFKHVAVDQTSSVRREFDLKSTVQDVVRTLKPTIRDSNTALNFSVPDDIRLDSYPGPLGQVLTNLINNALQHGFDSKLQGDGRTEDNRANSVTVEAAGEGDVVRIQVVDNGRGIPEAHQRRIFDPFFTTKLGQGGSGLGLNIVHKIVTTTLGGSITVSSTEGVGTTFTLQLPIASPVEAGTGESNEMPD